MTSSDNYGFAKNTIITIAKIQYLFKKTKYLPQASAIFIDFYPQTRFLSILKSKKHAYIYK